MDKHVELMQAWRNVIIHVSHLCYKGEMWFENDEEARGRTSRLFILGYVAYPQSDDCYVEERVEANN